MRQRRPADLGGRQRADAAGDLGGRRNILIAGNVVQGMSGRCAGRERWQEGVGVVVISTRLPCSVVA